MLYLHNRPWISPTLDQNPPTRIWDQMAVELTLPLLRVDQNAILADW